MDNSIKNAQDNQQISASPRPSVSASLSVKVLFFGATADAVGTREIEIDLPDGAKADNAFAQIITVYPNLKHHKLLFAVNQEYADGGKIIENGDELAVFTAVSGG